MLAKRMSKSRKSCAVTALFFGAQTSVDCNFPYYWFERPQFFHKSITKRLMDLINHIKVYTKRTRPVSTKPLKLFNHVCGLQILKRNYLLIEIFVRNNSIPKIFKNYSKKLAFLKFNKLSPWHVECIRKKLVLSLL